jgi:hypothetical protein
MSEANIDNTSLAGAAAAYRRARPTPEEIDALAEQWFAAAQALAEAKKAFDAIDDVGIAMVEYFGTVPPKAENSRRLDGKFTVLTVTVGNATSIDEERVIAVRDALRANQFEPIFHNLFKERTRHEMVKDAALAILAAGMPKRLTETVQKLFSRCFSTVKKAPSLKVKRLVEKPAKTKRQRPAAKALPDSQKEA